MGIKKYDVGYTTGVFDLFHIGHLNILKKSKELCNYLIVGVSTDELVAEYKHKNPVIPYNERVEIIRAFFQSKDLLASSRYFAFLVFIRIVCRVIQ